MFDSLPNDRHAMHAIMMHAMHAMRAMPAIHAVDLSIKTVILR